MELRLSSCRDYRRLCPTHVSFTIQPFCWVELHIIKNQCVSQTVNISEQYLWLKDTQHQRVPWTGSQLPDTPQTTIQQHGPKSVETSKTAAEIWVSLDHDAAWDRGRRSQTPWTSLELAELENGKLDQAWNRVSVQWISTCGLRPPKSIRKHRHWQ